jgi:hypothetical protein
LFEFPGRALSSVNEVIILEKEDRKYTNGAGGCDCKECQISGIVCTWVKWHALLGLGAVSSGNMDQDMCFEISDPCFLEKYAKFIHW